MIECAVYTECIEEETCHIEGWETGRGCILVDIQLRMVSSLQALSYLLTVKKHTPQGLHPKRKAASQGVTREVELPELFLQNPHVTLSPERDTKPGPYLTHPRM